MRPNRNRKKTSLYLSPDDRERVSRLQRQSGERTASGAIRYAIRKATESPRSTEQIGFEIIEWATRLQYMSSRERTELHAWSKELYEIENKRSCDNSPTRTQRAQRRSEP